MILNVKMEDKSAEVMERFNQCLLSFLEEGAAEIESAAIANTPVGETEALKGGWDHQINMGKGEAVIGNDAEHAIWLERGTGEYAINGDGRKGGWAYTDANGDTHFTYGNQPHRMLENAWNEKIDGVMNTLLPAKFGVMNG